MLCVNLFFSSSFALKVRLSPNIMRSNVLVCLLSTLDRFIWISMAWTDSGSQKYGHVLEKSVQVITFSFGVIPPHLIWLTQSNMCTFKYELGCGLLQSPHLLSVLKFYPLTDAQVSGEDVFMWSGWFDQDICKQDALQSMWAVCKKLCIWYDDQNCYER